MSLIVLNYDINIRELYSWNGIPRYWDQEVNHIGASMNYYEPFENSALNRDELLCMQSEFPVYKYSVVLIILKFGCLYLRYLLISNNF